MATNLKSANFVKVSSLEPSQSSLFVRAKVHAVEPVIDMVKADGSKIRLSEALVGDDSGCIILTVRGDYVDLVKAGESIEILNGRTEVFKGYLRLGTDKFSTIARAQSAVGQINLGHNLSNVEYEMVR